MNLRVEFCPKNNCVSPGIIRITQLGIAKWSLHYFLSFFNFSFFVNEKITLQFCGKDKTIPDFQGEKTFWSQSSQKMQHLFWKIAFRGLQPHSWTLDVSDISYLFLNFESLNHKQPQYFCLTPDKSFASYHLFTSYSSERPKIVRW